MHIALATCANLPAWEVDDRPLHEAFARLGVGCPRVVWDDPRVDWTAFDACLIRTTWDYQDNRGAFLEWAETVQAATRLYNGADVVRWNTHKSYLRDLEARGVPVVETVWLAAGSDAHLGNLLAERGWAKAFLKPAIGATARETMRFAACGPDLAMAQAHLERLLAREDMLLQPYLSSVESEGELSAVFIDGCLTHAVRKVPVPGDYRVQDDFGARDAPVRLAGEDLAAAWGALGAAGHEVLYARTDFLRDASGRLRLTELEAVEPSLFFRHAPQAAGRLAAAVCARVRAGRA